jgi:hypothetical protein
MTNLLHHLSARYHGERNAELIFLAVRTPLRTEEREDGSRTRLDAYHRVGAHLQVEHTNLRETLIRAIGISLPFKHCGAAVRSWTRHMMSSRYPLQFACRLQRDNTGVAPAEPSDMAAADTKPLPFRGRTSLGEEWRARS